MTINLKAPQRKSSTLPSYKSCFQVHTHVSNLKIPSNSDIFKFIVVFPSKYALTPISFLSGYPSHMLPQYESSDILKKGVESIERSGR